MAGVLIAIVCMCLLIIILWAADFVLATLESQ
jgi:preprotein translocase subunit SecE